MGRSFAIDLFYCMHVLGIDRATCFNQPGHFSRDKKTEGKNNKKREQDVHMCKQKVKKLCIYKW